MKELEKHLCFGGMLSVFEHESSALKCTMKFSVYLPPAAEHGNVPAVTFLSGLTCTHDNFTTKAGAYGVAADLGMAIIAPDTSPRGDDVADNADSYDVGKGAGFYINATEAPWAANYQMETYIADELYHLVAKAFPIATGRQGIFGHSMGGHGALTLALKYPERYQSVSAFSPIGTPSQVPWGQKAFASYLGDDAAEWKKHDATELMKQAASRDAKPAILIDQGLDDQFLSEQLKPELFAEACKQAGQKLDLRMHAGYDHSYYFIQSFMADHLCHHANLLR